MYLDQPCLSFLVLLQMGVKGLGVDLWARRAKHMMPAWLMMMPASSNPSKTLPNMNVSQLVTVTHHSVASRKHRQLSDRPQWMARHIKLRPHL